MSRPERPTKRATALRYEGRDAPKVVATGKGLVAEKILEAARAAGVPLREDPVLVQALATLELDQEIPPELYRAVAEALAWAYQLSQKSPPKPVAHHAREEPSS
ncbi:MAG: flagellar biosynthesis protein [Gaiellales bacterium]|jgi:flagellar biosynthesis protein|nr:flagellar biosynthesis protein [Gaiellales bacterium]